MFKNLDHLSKKRMAMGETCKNKIIKQDRPETTFHILCVYRRRDDYIVNIKMDSTLYTVYIYICIYIYVASTQRWYYDDQLFSTPPTLTNRLFLSFCDDRLAIASFFFSHVEG